MPEEAKQISLSALMSGSTSPSRFVTTLNCPTCPWSAHFLMCSLNSCALFWSDVRRQKNNRLIQNTDQSYIQPVLRNCVCVMCLCIFPQLYACFWIIFVFRYLSRIPVLWIPIKSWWSFFSLSQKQEIPNQWAVLSSTCWKFSMYGCVLFIFLYKFSNLQSTKLSLSRNPLSLTSLMWCSISR